MSVLVDHEIMSLISEGAIVIEPFDRKNLGTNSYDVRLAPSMRVYATEREHVKTKDGRLIATDEIPLDVRVPRDTVTVRIPDDGLVLQPGELYLASTVEYTESHRHLPMLNGRSSLGRLGLSIHVTAGTGDVGFCGHWTLELFVVKPLRIYPNMSIGLLLWFAASEPDVPYSKKTSAKYNNHDPMPMSSRFHRNEE